MSRSFFMLPSPRPRFFFSSLPLSFHQLQPSAAKHGGKPPTWESIARRPRSLSGTHAVPRDSAFFSFLITQVITLPPALANIAPALSSTRPGAEASSDSTFRALPHAVLNGIGSIRALSPRTDKPDPPPLKLNAVAIAYFSGPTQTLFSNSTVQAAPHLAARANDNHPSSHVFISFADRWALIYIPTAAHRTFLALLAIFRSPLPDLEVEILSRP